MDEQPGYSRKEQHRFRLYEHGELRPAVKGATGTENIVITHFVFLHQLLSVANVIKTKTRWTGHVAHTFTMATTIMMLMESQTKTSVSKLKGNSLLRNTKSNENISDVTIGWANVKWFNPLNAELNPIC